MMNFFYQQGWGMMNWGNWGPMAGLGSIIMIALVVWSLYWKGMSMWTAARKGDRNWFIALLVLNTLGILDILYIYVFSKPKEEKPAEPVQS